ncbi:MAG: glycosyltransferase family 4 protein, partial [bacterium]|nr:glycosyltransferase family 4 protein [bacterium]
QVYTALSKHHERISRIQVSHSQMREAILQTGIEPAKVFLIPIGVNLDFFPFGSAETKIAARHKFNIPQSAFVIGSFQKDGVGWEEGLEPKLIKGPDILTRTLKQLKKTIPELFVLLVGPARGYVKVDLERLGIPYRDLLWQPYPEVGQLFSTLDLYLVTSRQEGGPKAVLESMASGVPLVTTRVGQAMDLVRHGENAWMVDVEDVDGLAYWAKFVYEHENAGLDAVLQAGRATAEANSYTAQLPLWEKFMEGFVAWEKSNP